MIRAIAIAFLMIPLLASSQTSNVQTVKAWMRTHIIGKPGGTLLDPTGTLADGQRMAAAEASATASSNIVAAAALGLTNALQRLWSEADHTNDYTGRLYLGADLEPDPDYQNVEAFRVSETIQTNGIAHYFVHFTRELSVPPQTIWRFQLAPGIVYWAAGSTATNNATTNVLGLACYDIQVRKPSAVGNAVLTCNKYLLFGAPDTPLDIPDAGLRIIAGTTTNTPYTGNVVFTNAGAGIVVTENYQSGFLYLTETNGVSQ